jgi:hypothetical protein
MGQRLNEKWHKYLMITNGIRGMTGIWRDSLHSARTRSLLLTKSLKVSFFKSWTSLADAMAANARETMAEVRMMKCISSRGTGVLEWSCLKANAPTDRNEWRL